jgi:hypothetical protein
MLEFPMRSTLIASLAFLGLLGACADQAGPDASVRPDYIVNGTPTGSAYGNVGALLFDFDANGVINGDDEWCTGSLISPTIFLTAAHCVLNPYTPPGTQFYVSFSPDLYTNLQSTAATGYVHDPLYGHDQANLHDLALVFIPSSATTGITPLQLPPAGYLDQQAAKGKLRQQLFVNVGYGTSSTRTGIPGFPYDGIRKSSQSEFMGLQPTWLGLLMNTSATGKGGDCYGDSGGPKFLDGNTSMIVATVVTGDFPCRATTWDWRLDTPEARGFLGQYVSLP